MNYTPTGFSGQSNPQPMLKPCPFCKSKDVHLSKDVTALNEDCIHCLNCDISVKAGWFNATVDELIERWNRRAIE